MTEKDKIKEKVLEIKRVSKKTTGGNHISFSALVVVGSDDGNIGIARGKALDVTSAIHKAVDNARKNMVLISKKNATIPHEASAKFKATRVLLKPAPPGTGIIAGSSVRHVIELAGIRDISAKIIGGTNKETAAWAALKALRSLRNVNQQQ